MQCDQTTPKKPTEGMFVAKLPRILESNVRMGVVCGLSESAHQITHGPALKHPRSNPKLEPPPGSTVSSSSSRVRRHILKSNVRMGVVCGLSESLHQITLGPVLKHSRSNPYVKIING